MELKTEHQQLADAITENEKQIRDIQSYVANIKYTLIQITKSLENIAEELRNVTR